MKKTVLGILLVSAILGVKGQEVEREELPVDVRSQPENQQKTFGEEFEGFIDYEQLPQYKGGEKALAKYLKDSLIYPKSARENKIQGIVVVGFIVDKMGVISKIKVLKSLGYGCDEEVIRLIQKMPAWIPGRQSGNAISIPFTLPIRFDLSK